MSARLCLHKIGDVRFRCRPSNENEEPDTRLLVGFAAKSVLPGALLLGDALVRLLLAQLAGGVVRGQRAERGGAQGAATTSAIPAAAGIGQDRRRWGLAALGGAAAVMAATGPGGAIRVVLASVVAAIR